MGLRENLPGRLQKIPVSPAASLQAVFEAVANAFDATDHNPQAGRIIVRILRKPSNELFKTGGADDYVLHGFEIEDNGVGFTAEHLNHFGECDNTNKIGGKGIGRLVWLKVFNLVEIESVFEENGKRWKREFPFSLQTDGLDEDKARAIEIEVDDTLPLGTKVRLLSPMRDRLVALEVDQQSLALKLLEHFLLRFTVLAGQSLTVVNSRTGEEVAVADLYKDEIGERHEEEPIDIRNWHFALHHLLIKPTTIRKNLFRLCANRRVVTSELLNSFISEVSAATAVTGQGNFRYHAYVTGSFLDEKSDDARSTITFDPDQRSDDDEDGESQPDMYSSEGVSKSELLKSVSDKVREYLSEHIKQVRQSKEKQLENYAMHEQPQFRPYVDRAKKNLERLKSNPTKKAIELVLYEAKIDGRSEMNKLVDEIIKGSPAHGKVEAAYGLLVEKFTQEASAANLYALTDYVCLRRAVISVLKTLQQKEGDANRSNTHETVIHNLFFPRYSTSDQIPCGPHGVSSHREIAHLWLLDERLVFHRLLASDIPPSKMRGFLSNDNNPTDIVVFDPAFSTTDDLSNLGSVSIIEFKRPGRNDFGPSEKRDPILQVIKYASKIRKGMIEDINGAKKAVPENARLYAYIVADPTETLQERLGTYGFNSTPDRRGYYWYHASTSMLIEVIPWDKLISDTERRNAVFFEKLDL